jgi:hypothetical protein
VETAKNVHSKIEVKRDLKAQIPEYRIAKPTTWVSNGSKFQIPDSKVSLRPGRWAEVFKIQNTEYRAESRGEAWGAEYRFQDPDGRLVASRLARTREQRECREGWQIPGRGNEGAESKNT